MNEPELPLVAPRTTEKKKPLKMSRCFKKKDEKPNSLPKNWPHPTPANLEERPRRFIKIGVEQEYKFRNNFVKTSKYEVWNFLPKFMFEELNPQSKIANCYFLVIAALQCIGPISNTKGYPTTLIPLSIVILVDGIFAVLEDMARHKADADANASIANLYDPITKEFLEVTWAELNVGDFIRVDSRKTIPADILVLSVTEKSEPPLGICYVETKSLDGETNLKIRNALPLTMSLSRTPSALGKLKGDIEMEHPNKLIDSFDGVIDLTGIGREPILPNNVLLRGCVLRNTDHVYGCVLNTGHDTKIMMSNTETPSKLSNMELKASYEIRRIILLLVCVCLVGCTGQLIWLQYKKINHISYLHWDPSLGGEWVVQFFYFFLLHATFIPVSLYVSMSLTRFFQSYFMIQDLEMYYAKTDSPMTVRTMTLNEELGQISHIFSDKTGTLTCNVMDFRKCSINGVSYGVGITEIGKASWKLQGKEIPQEVLEGEMKAKANAVPHVSFYCPDYDRDIATNPSQRQKIHQFFRVLSICHDVTPEKIDGKVKLSASNPDDEALVYAAAYFGFDFVDRRERYIVVRNKSSGREDLAELLATIEFTSKRKRMSVIVKDADGVIRVYSKGADVAMVPRLARGQEGLLTVSDNHMRQYAVEGLRCLMICSADLTQEQYASWSQRYHEACADLSQIERKKKGLDNRIEELEDAIERNLSLLGETAIEDRLQDGVPETIADLARAGINIWVLTGDKEETAINIAVACNLVQPREYMDQIVVNKSTFPDNEAMLRLFKQESLRYEDELHEKGTIYRVKPRALIIDGPSLISAMADTDSGGVKESLLTFAKKCKAVVGCRVSPDQKREMVNLIKEGVPGVRTLAIGDGANDVAMIQEAHVGVGIKGEEGVQAVNASDFAISQFRFLCPLLLKHGRFNYVRMSKLVIYMFYKNILMSICMHWFAYFNGFSGQKIFPEAGIQLYNLLFTSLPILLLSIGDMDVSAKAAYRYPQLYTPCIRNEFFQTNIFWGWVFQAIIEAVFFTVMAPHLLSNSEPNYGTYNTFFESGALTFTAVVVVVNLKICFLQCRWTLVHVACILLSVLLWWVTAYLWQEQEFFFWFDPDWYKLWNALLDNPSFWLGLFVMCVATVCKDIFLTYMERDINPKPHQIVQEVRGLNLGMHLLDAASNASANRKKLS